MYKRWFHMELIINSYVVGKGGTRMGILILSTTKCREGGTRMGILILSTMFHVYYI